jgi:hypothetical protein
MDPAACLDLIAGYLDEDNAEEATYLLGEYRRWRSRGGFEPDCGDARERELRSRLRDLLHQRRHQGGTHGD